ncbi:beta-galactosidase-1-like protein isoform X3 [Lemur catta]|uniref:beta-galactosidase-1-like protein isoform X3 n=1 Tax=Lemur catta TaxID=9447 RepID=UPI001E26C302|nr:beta-galactosidase-1-like protein isoform X3 [Lemur catta]
MAPEKLPLLPSFLLSLLTLLLPLLTLLLPQADTRSFIVDPDHDRFLLDGVPFRYVSGSLHYFRVPRVLWADRLLKMRMSGLNAIQFYVPWNYHEPHPGVYNFNGSRNLIAFLHQAAIAKLLVILRPGPYICAEWEMGGLPSWLLQKPKIHLRTSDPDFLAAVDSWFKVLLPKIYPWLYHNGGNIISIQVENEYGSYRACDFSYMRHLAGLFRALLGDKILLFTTDGPEGLRCGSLQGLYTTVDFGPGLQSKGTCSMVVPTLDTGMFQEVPLGPLPPASRKMMLGPLTLHLDGDLLAFLDILCPRGPIHSILPMTFEAVKQDHGFVLYRTYLTHTVFEPTPLWVPHNGLHDRAYVMVDGVFQGVLERNMRHKVFLMGNLGARLDILVENMGRLSFGSNSSDFKGLLEPPILGQTILIKWMMFPLIIDNLVKWWFPLQLPKSAQPQAPSGPTFYSTTFPILGSVGDTFLYLPGWTKGQVWINGFNLGRYWTKRGPQQTLYVPRPLLFSSGQLNKITLLELENVPPRPQIQFLDKPILNSTLHKTYIYSLLADTLSTPEPMRLSGH